ncbi:MAG: 1-deoxy-D-xylulose-5-phosphate reductoisomerase [Chloroflexota bacterium]|jgi:1-deoxy-D-xylulose-5-phosphate reductoisomerase|tara:strand:+ start:22406 stop:23551 length:1146 start_codon:yes stop_codon:yes gene_type:complete
MDDRLIGIALLGSTGSIGTQTLDIVRRFPDRIKVVALSAHNSTELLKSQIEEFKPKFFNCSNLSTKIENGMVGETKQCSYEDMVTDDDVDLVVTATVGDVALVPTICALQAGKTVALANKESIVMAGDMLMQIARTNNSRILPVDSEPNAIWQCLRGEDQSISKLFITASGGAMRGMTDMEKKKITPELALQHPTWTMGPKITIDSATLMNKAFEVIEAKWLFDVEWEQIEVVIHPESMIHSMVEFEDGSVKAQISPPDMKLPIQYALLYPDRMFNPDLARFNPVKLGSLTFESVNFNQYPCFSLGLDYGSRVGTSPAVLCGADEMAVESFLKGAINFYDIPVVIKEALQAYQPVVGKTPEDYLSAAAWGRSKVADIINLK